MKWNDFFLKLGSLEKYYLMGLATDTIRKPLKTFIDSDSDEERDLREKLFQILRLEPESLKKLLTNENVNQEVINDLIEIIESTPKPEVVDVVKSINFWVKNNSIEDFVKIFKFIMNNMFIYRNYSYNPADISVVLENIDSVGGIDVVIFDYTYSLFEIMVRRGLCRHSYSPSKVKKDFINDFGLSEDLTEELTNIMAKNEKRLLESYSRYNINLISRNIDTVLKILKSIFKNLE